MRQTQTNYIDSQVIEYQVSNEVKDKLQECNLTLVNSLNLSGGIPTESIKKITHEVKFILVTYAFPIITLSQEHKVERKERSIGELMTTKEGRDFWEQNGFWWEGEFDLKDNSDNMTALMNYLMSKGINVSF